MVLIHRNERSDYSVRVHILYTQYCTISVSLCALLICNAHLKYIVKVLNTCTCHLRMTWNPPLIELSVSIADFNYPCWNGRHLEFAWSIQSIHQKVLTECQPVIYVHTSVSPDWNLFTVGSRAAMRFAIFEKNNVDLYHDIYRLRRYNVICIILD